MFNNFIPLIKSFYCNSILPQLYTDSLSYSEQLYVFLNRLNELTNRVNSLNEFVKTVAEMVEELDKHIAETVKEQLQIWYDDGTLKNILAEVSKEFFEELKSELLAITIKTPVLNPTRVFRAIRDFGDFDSSLTTGVPYYSWLQGYTAYTDGNGNLRHVMCLISQNTGFTTNNTVQLVIFDDKGEIVRQSSFILGHAQSIIYLNGNFYVAFSYEFTDGEQVNSNKVAIIDEGTLTNYQVKTFDRMVHELATDGENIYCSSIDNATIYKMNFENSTTELLFYNQDIKTTIQGMAIYRGYFWIATSTPAKICVIDYNGNLFYEYKVPRSTDDLYNIGEFQGLSVVGDTFYFGTFSKLGQPSTAQLINNQVFKFNVLTNKGCNSTGMYRGVDTRIFYVDSYATGKNPTGEQDNPFLYVQEAIESSCNCKEGSIEIHIVNDSHYAVFIRSNKTYNIVSDMDTRAVIGGCTTMLTPFIRFSNIAFSQSNTQWGTACLDVQMGNVLIHSCRFNPTSNPATYVQTDYGCRSLGAVMVLDTINNYENNETFQTRTGKQQYVSNTGYITPAENNSV